MTIREAAKSPSGVKKSPEQKTEDQLKVDRVKLQVTDKPEQKQKIREKIGFNQDKLRFQKSKRGHEKASDYGDLIKGYAEKVYKKAESQVADWAFDVDPEDQHDAISDGILDIINDMKLTEDKKVRADVKDKVMEMCGY